MWLTAISALYIGSFVKEAQAAISQNVELPPGYLVTWGGQFRLQQEANKRLAVVVPVTLLVVCLLLFSSFGSIKNTILILMNIPLALVGGVVALWLSGQNLSVPASVGFIALFGIALENGMVLVTHLNQLLRDGVAVDEAWPYTVVVSNRYWWRGPASPGNSSYRWADNFHYTNTAGSPCTLQVVCGPR